MRLIIDIDDELYNDAKSGYVRLSEIADAVLSGTPYEKRPTGHWNPYRCDMYTCSECDTVYTELLDTHRCLANFCPNCGAKMTENGCS